MTKNDVKPEILSPAGDWTSLNAAIDGGCDAVYFGIKGLNMRAGAKNFLPTDMKAIVRHCNKHDVKSYLALNTIVYEDELPKIKDLLNIAKLAGVDAVICWDLGVVNEAKRKGIDIHLSTQMSVANSESIIHFYEHLGIRRFVLARECTLNHIRQIQKRLSKRLGERAGEIEIECFVHGAMCVSISGRCFLSTFLYGKSANRGECLQPCRREYTIRDKDEKYNLTLGNNYILSPKDLCTLPFLEKLIEAKINSFKIEGRNRSPEYVYTVTKAYREAVDYYFENRNSPQFKKDFDKLKTRLLARLEKVFNRGFSSGFYMGQPINQWTDGGGNKSPTKKEYVGIITKYYRRIGVAEIKIEAKGINSGDRLIIQGPSTGVVIQTASSLEKEHEKISSAKKGETIACKVIKRVRPKDRVFVEVQANPSS